MTAIFRMSVLAAGHGDCLWIEYGDSEAPARVLVDAGTIGTFRRLEPLLDKVRGQAPSHELFLVTHVDADHIGGALQVVETPQIAAQFREIWFNGRRHLLEAQGLEHFGAVQGERLTQAILDQRMAWNASFGGRPVMRAAGAKPQTTTIRDAVVTVLTPTAKELADLLIPWDKEITAAGLAPTIDATPPKDVVGFESFGALDVAALARKVVPEDAAPANGSSIATLWEFSGKRLLLGADAHPSVLLAGIRQLQPEGRLKVDVFKLPHHGSAANVTKALLDAVDCKVIVFSSNGAHFRHPDQAAVARVLVRHRDQGVHLVFNYKTAFNDMWDDDGLRRDWNYTTEYGVGESGVTVRLR